MKKRTLKRALTGFPIGLAIGYTITLFITLAFGNGSYIAVTPMLIEETGSEAAAVYIQALLFGLLGSGFHAMQTIWECEQWSLLKQTALYFTLGSLLMLPVAYIMHWMNHTLLGFITYYGIFILLFSVIWLIQYSIIKRSIAAMNKVIESSLS